MRITPACSNSESTVTSEARSARRCGRRGPGPGGRAATLDRDDRLRASHTPRNPRELARIPERLQIQQDDRRFASHQKGHVDSTKAYCPVKLRSYVAVETEIKARELEKYCKSGSGKAIARKRFL